MKQASSLISRPKALLVLLAGICFFTAGMLLLVFGALKQSYPTITLTGLFRLGPLVQTVYGLAP